MLTGKALFNTLVAELNDMGLPGMSSTLDEMYRSADFVKLDPLMAIAMLVEPEYQKKITKRIQGRLCSAHLRGCPQELSNCVDSAAFCAAERTVERLLTDTQRRQRTATNQSPSVEQ